MVPQIQRSNESLAPALTVCMAVRMVRAVVYVLVAELLDDSAVSVAEKTICSIRLKL